MAPPRRRLGELLVEAGVLDPMQLTAALGYQRQWGGKLGTVLVERGFLTEARLVETLAQQLKVPVVQITRTRVDARAIQVLPAAVAEQLHVFPLELKGSDKSETLIVAMCDPTDLGAVDQLQFRTRRRIQTVLAGEKDIKAAIRRHYYNEDAPPPDDERSRPPVPQQKLQDAHLIDSGSDQVPGLMSWGGDTNAATLPPQNQPAAPVPAQPMYAQPYYGGAQVPYATAYPGMPPQQMGGQVAAPVGVPPGFLQAETRGRPMQVSPGMGVVAQPGQQMQRAPVSRAPVPLDPFADDSDPLAGLDPSEARSSPPESISFDPLEDSNDDSWKSALEPIASTIGHDPLAGTDPLGNDPFADVHGKPAPVQTGEIQISSGDDGEDLEMLDVDVEPLDEDPAPKATRTRSMEEAIDAAAEGWLTPTEETSPPRAALVPTADVSGDEDPWRTVSESSESHATEAPAEEDPWATPSDEVAEPAPEPVAPAEDTAASWETAEAPQEEEVASWETPAEETAAEVESAGEPAEPAEGEWIERAVSPPAPDAEPADTSWIEPIAETIGHEPQEEPLASETNSEESLELASPDAETPAEGWGSEEVSEAAGDLSEQAAAEDSAPAASETSAEAWGDDGLSEPPAEQLEQAAEADWTTESEETPQALSDEAAPTADGDGWTTTSEAAEEPLAEQTTAEAADAWAAAPENPEEPVASDPAPEPSDEWATASETPAEELAAEEPAAEEPPAETSDSWAIAAETEEPAAETDEPSAEQPSAVVASAEDAAEPPASWETESAEEESLTDWVGGSESAAAIAEAVPENPAEVAAQPAAQDESWSDVPLEDDAPPDEPEAAASLDEWAAAGEQPAASAWGAAPASEPAETESGEAAALTWGAPSEAPEPDDVVIEETWSEPAPSAEPPAADATVWASGDDEVTPGPDEFEPPGAEEPASAAVAWAAEAEPPSETEPAATWADGAVADEGEAAAGWAASGQVDEPDTQPPASPSAVIAAAADTGAKPEGGDEWDGFGSPEAAAADAPEPGNGVDVSDATDANRAAATRGWSLVGVEHPTAEDAVQTMGLLLDMLVAKGALDPAELGRALREARERAGS